jgi:hypothetical protein
MATTTTLILIDDFAGMDRPGRPWHSSRIATSRGEMGQGDYSVTLGRGLAGLRVKTSGWAGVWTSLIHDAAAREELDPRRILGPYILDQFQPQITGLRLHVLDGQGALKIEIKDLSGQILYSNNYPLTGGEVTLEAPLTLQSKLKFLNIILDGPGHVNYDRIWLITDTSYRNSLEAAFLYSYGHLTQCYDPAFGLVRDDANWPVEYFANIPAIGTYALGTSIAFQLGYVSENSANVIVQKGKDVLLGLPRYHGLLPHFTTHGGIAPYTEWSSIDTVTCLISAILACQSLNVSTAALESMVQSIDWNDLTASSTKPVSHGYDYRGKRFKVRWDVFGSEAFLIALAYAAANGSVPLIPNADPPTWNGSGFIDEMAALFFPMNFRDQWGNHWSDYRIHAASAQIQKFAPPHYYSQYSLFGLSASEVPEQRVVPVGKRYEAWGMGGRTPYNDGSKLAGYPIIAPHYAALIAGDFPTRAEALFDALINHFHIFSPLNSVESLGVDDQNQAHWNAKKGAWNLSLQTLGLGKALSGSNYIVYDALLRNEFLMNGFKILQQS